MKIVVFDDLLCRRPREYDTPGLELVFYEHADDAVAVVRGERPDIVLMDYSMNASASGADAISALRRVFSRRDLPIVAISSDFHSNEQMLDVGADDALPKSHLRGYLSRLAKLGRDA